MYWNIVNFGKYKDKNKTLPQIIFDDADWFFWAYEKGALLTNGIPKDEVELIYKRATRIKPKVGCYVKHFLYSDGTSWGFDFIHIDEAEKNYPEYIGGNCFGKDYINLDSTYRTILKYIDLSFPRQQKNYDKKGCKKFTNSLKSYILNVTRITKKIAEDFFANEDNFWKEKF